MTETAAFKARHRHTLELLLKGYEARSAREEAPVLFCTAGITFSVKNTGSGHGEVWQVKGQADDGDERLILNLDRLAEATGYLHVCAFRVSPDGHFLAYAIDLDGHEWYRVCVLDLATLESQTLAVDSAGDLEWSNDSRSLWTVRRDGGRAAQAWRYDLTLARAALVYAEPDPAAILELRKSRSGQYLFLSVQSATSGEVRLYDASDQDDLGVFVPREDNVRYTLDHDAVGFVMLRHAKRASVTLHHNLNDQPGDLIRLPPGVEPYAVELQGQHIAVFAQSGPTQHLVIYNPRTKVLSRPEFPSGVLTLAPWTDGTEREGIMWCVGSGPAHPEWVYAVPLAGGATRRAFALEVVQAHDPDRYLARTLFVPTPDGVAVPLTLIHHEGQTWPAPVYLHVYGAYGQPCPTTFSAGWIPFLERGGVLGFAHVRGGGEYGEAWHAAGRGRSKHMSADDLHHCCDHLVQKGWTDARSLALHGESAGGWTVAAYLNAFPSTCQAVVLRHPYLDSLGDLQGHTPRAYLEAEEWGHPECHADVAYAEQHSPLQNVKPAAYPAALVFAGLQDDRVDIRGIEQWCARVREVATNHPLVLLEHTEAGHLGPSSREQHWRSQALEFAFILDAITGGNHDSNSE